MKKFLTISVVAFCLMSCEEYYFQGMIAPAGESVNERFEQSMDYNESHGYQTVRAVSDDYRVYVFTDCHLDGASKNLDRFVSEYLQDSGAAPFTICLGDLVNGDESFSEFISHTSAIGNAGRKLFLTAGNHDLYWGRWKEFYRSFGSSTYWFEVETPSAKDLFISLESGGGTLGTGQRDWLEETLETKGSGYRNIVVFTHTHFFMRDMSQGHTDNFALEETYDLADLFSGYGVNLVISGHDHHREQTGFKGVDYLVVDCMKEKADNAAYAILSVGKSIDVEFVPLS